MSYKAEISYKVNCALRYWESSNHPLLPWTCKKKKKKKKKKKGKNVSFVPYKISYIVNIVIYEFSLSIAKKKKL
jgi:uncharacterized Tic20 family protein